MLRNREESLHGGALLSNDEFSEDFDTLRALYDRLETMLEASQILGLLDLGKQVRQGIREWTKDDLESIVSWRGLQPLMSKIEREANIELSLARAFKIQDEEGRTEALCRIPGIGPVLASVLLTLTFPEKYAPLDSHTWNALSHLGFELRKRPFSGGGYTIPELLRYLILMKTLAKVMKATPWETAKALYALDKVKMKTRWKRELDSLRPPPPILASSSD